MNTYNNEKENISTISHSLKEKEYWRNKLSGGIEKVSFPHDLTGDQDEMANYKFEIKDEIFKRILSLSKGAVPMIYMILVSNLKALIFKSLGENNLVIGSPVEKQKDNKNLINTILPLRSQISNNLSYKELLLQVRKTVIEAIDNQNYPFETMKNDLKTGYSSKSFNPLFDISVYMDNLHDKSYLEGAESSMIFGFNKCEDRIEACIDYNSSLYKRETIERLGKLYVQLMEQLLFNIDKQFSEVSLVSTEEYNLLITDWNKTTSSYSIKKSIIDVFENQVKKNGSEIALSEDGKTITYKELDEQVNRFANFLKKRKIEKGTVIGILLDRSIDFMVSTLAILKVECVFLPIDIGSNDERIKFILDDSGCELLITNNDFNKSSIYEGDKIIFNSESFESYENSAPVRNYSEDETAYIIYTSGTTGKPKGTYVLHRGLTNYILWASETYVKGEKLSFPLFTSVAFDLTITSIFTPLASGGTLYIYNSKESGNLIEEIIKENKVNVIKLTPSHLKLIRNYKLEENPNEKSRIKRFIVGGEQLETVISKEIFDKFNGNIEIFNEYGPTEATVGSMIYKYDKKDKGIAVPIGKPIANTQIYLLNRFLEPVPQGFQGEIFIAGSGLAGGYHKKPELTAAKFIDNPFVAGEKMYKTGDLGRINEDNNLEFIGRKDHQVKIRGYRVELGEIENKIQNHLKENFSESPISPEDYLQLNLEEQKRCTKCLLPENYEKITIGDDGVCSLCNEFESYKEKAFDYFKTLDDLDKLMQESRKTSKSKYDCLLLFSGGKDSTYVLHRLVKMGLNILTFTYDNGYISKQAFENIEKITKKYNVDSLIIESDNMKEVLCESLKTDHNVCNGCFKGVNTVGAKIANEYGINVVFSGLSRGQIFEIKLQGLFKLGIRDSKEIDEQLKIFRREYHSMNTKTSRLLNIEFEDSELDNIKFVDYFRYDDIKTRDVLDYLIKVDKSWDKPADTGTSSSNCMINDVGIYVHYKDKGYHFYADQSSWDCRLETISREEGIDELKGFNPDYKKIGEVLNELGYYQSSTSAVVVARTDKTGDKVLCAYFVADKKVDISSLQKSIAGQLPEYMIPSYYMQVDKIPLTLSGKVNTDLLPEPKIVIETKYVAPTTPTEKKVAEIWSDVLDINIDEIGIYNNFFELGGHSLKATLLISEIEKRLFVKTPLVKIFENPTICELANLIDQQEKKIFAALKRVEQKKHYSLSSAQKRLHFLQSMDPENTIYNIPLVMPWGEEVDIDLLNATFNKLIKRHESFRTSFETVNEEPVQIVHDEVTFKMDYFEAKSQDEEKSLIADYIKPFDLSKAPLLRSSIIKSHDGQFIWVVDMHHIISDGTSRAILEKEFHALYSGEELAPLTLQYKDYCQWQNSEEQQELIKDQEQYWLDKFEGEIPVLNLPTDYARPLMQSYQGATVNFVLDKEETEGIKYFTKENDLTLYMSLLSIFNILLSKLSGQEDIVVGTPMAGRNHAELENIVGMFINTLSIRNNVKGEETIQDFVSGLKQTVIGAYENQDYQFEDLVDKVSLVRDTSRNPIFDVMINLLNYSENSFDLSSLDKQKHIPGISKFDLSLTAVDYDDQLILSLEYCTQLFKAETIDRFIVYFKKIVSQIANNSKLAISEIEIISDEEKQQLLYDFNNTKVDYPKDKTIHQLFEEQVERTPENVAIYCAGEEISYKDLSIKSNQLANYLLSNVSGEKLIAIMSSRSIDMIVGILGVLKSGHAYLPLDVKQPLDRNKKILQESQTEVIIADSNDFSFEGIKSIDLRNESIYKADTTSISNVTKSSDLAYVIYTSGSTGVPKGVMISHENIVNFVTGMSSIFTEDEKGSVLSMTTISFDIFGLELYVPLFKGMSMVLAKDQESTDIKSLGSIIRDKQVSVLQLTPSRLSLILSDDNSKDIFEHIKVILVGGEELPKNLLVSLRDIYKGKIYNMYGPTETTIWSTFKDVSGNLALNIGKPISNTQIYILDKSDKIQPIGVVGELCVSGAGLAQGYFKDSGLTAEKFIPHPFKEGERLYRTGDLARWLPDGNIEFLGRIDHQVKIRGFRIELGEIESALLRQESITESLVIAIEENGDKQLCAYVVCKSDFIEEDVRANLAELLPVYMIPSYFVKLDSFPLTSNGKINRKALASPKIKVGEEYIAPSNEIEEKLVEIWSEVLHIPMNEISVNTNFFNIGGHSLKASLLVNKIFKQLDVEVPLNKIFEYTDIRSQGKAIAQLVKSGYNHIEKAKEKEYYKSSASQNRLYVWYELNKESTAYNMPQIMNLGTELDKERLRSVLEHLILRHETLRTSFEKIDNEVMQKISGQINFDIEYFESTTENFPEQFQKFIRPFDLSKAPLFRVGVVKTENLENLLMIDMHHIISDGFSQKLLIKDFMSLYNNEKLDELKLQYKDYSEWQHSDIGKEEIKKQSNYWINEFKEGIPSLDVITDYERPQVQSFEGANKSFIINSDRSKQIMEFCQRKGITEFMYFMSVYTLLWHKLLNKEKDLIFGVGLSGRIHPDVQEIIGFFVNTLPFCMDISPDMSFDLFIEGVKNKSFQLMDNQGCQFEDLIMQGELEKKNTKLPLFEAAFVWQNLDSLTIKEEEFNVIGGNSGLLDNQGGTAKFDVLFSGQQYKDGFKLNLNYSTKLFKESTIIGLQEMIGKIIENVTADVSIPLSSINVIREDVSSKLSEMEEDNIMEDIDFTF